MFRRQLGRVGWCLGGVEGGAGSYRPEQTGGAVRRPEEPSGPRQHQTVLHRVTTETNPPHVATPPTINPNTLDAYVDVSHKLLLDDRL